VRTGGSKGTDCACLKDVELGAQRGVVRRGAEKSKRACSCSPM
jgi:hypothetical protein